MGNLAARLLFFVPALAVSSALAAQAPRDEIRVDMESFSLDGSSNLIHFLRPTITQANLKIEAEDAFATGVEFEDHSEWRFKGHVRITADGAVMEAESAVFTFDKNQLSRGELVGAPASFTDARAEPGKEPVRGSANKIFLDYVAQTLRLSEQVTISKDRLYAQGCDVIYDFKNEGFRSGDADCGGETYKIRVLNTQSEGPATATPAPP
jgi:lipopolysaccharide transport protein LptA